MTDASAIGVFSMSLQALVNSVEQALPDLCDLRADHTRGPSTPSTARPCTADHGRNSVDGPALSRYDANGDKFVVMVVAFNPDCHSFSALNGGEECRFNEAISFQVQGDTRH